MKGAYVFSACEMIWSEATTIEILGRVSNCQLCLLTMTPARLAHYTPGLLLFESVLFWCVVNLQDSQILSDAIRIGYDFFIFVALIGQEGAVGKHNQQVNN